MASSEDIKRLAALSRLSFSDEELPRFAKDIDTILAYVGTLESLSIHAQQMREGVQKNVFREDTAPHEKKAFTAALVGAFPEESQDLLQVKRILSE